MTFGTDKETPGIIGNGVDFIGYVEKELMPYIEDNYPTASSQNLLLPLTQTSL